MPDELVRLLLVEDDPDIQEVARMSLELVGGFSLTVCSSGAEALRVAPTSGAQLVLLDVMMPGMDGPETLAALRGLDGFAQVPTVFMTAKVQPTEVARFLELGAVGVIAKPFDPMALPDQVRSLWRNAHV
ncbi:response regulator [Arenibaculum pallidiluteum]|uniref:response regulator n=1 Tax=Arenibaculum pallidiluteum TaxID=2812559 RepID=UPI001A96E581|nr:response regulator [Arenibaculum pallidiluteum]